MRFGSVAWASFAFLLTVPVTVSADYTVWTSPLAAFQPVENGVETIASPLQALRVQSATAGTTIATYECPLTLPSDQVIDSITVCSSSGNASFYVTNVKLVRMLQPDNTATTLLDDPTDRVGPAAQCFNINVADAAVTGTITLELQMVVGGTSSGWVQIGAIGVRLKAPVTDVGQREPQSRPAELAQNRPNPFRTPTMIDYEVEQNAPVRLDIFDIQGRRLRTLVNRELAAGKYSASWDGSSDSGRPLPAGAYVYRLVVGDREASRQMIRLE